MDSKLIYDLLKEVKEDLKETRNSLMGHIATHKSDFSKISTEIKEIKSDISDIKQDVAEHISRTDAIEKLVNKVEFENKVIDKRVEKNSEIYMDVKAAKMSLKILWIAIGVLSTIFLGLLKYSDVIRDLMSK